MSLSSEDMSRLTGSALADDIASQIRRYVVLDDDQADTVALWILHAWTIDAFFTTGRLYINSPEPECGKTQLLRTVQYLLSDVINAASISAPVLYRRLATGTPAFLVDEVDTTIGAKSAKESESQSALIGILNSGYARGATVERVNRQSMKVESFPTFCPVAVAGISSNFSDAFLSRTIPIDLRRKLRHEKADRWIDGPKLRVDFDALKARVETWAHLHLEALRGREIDYPDELSDRQIECWGPLIAIADQVGGAWPDRVRRSYLRIAGAPSEAEGAGHRLLVDIREVFEEREWLATTTMVSKLNAMEGADYDTWNRGKGMSAKTLAGKLDPYRILPLRRQIEGEQTRGYAKDQFEDAWARYAPIDPTPSLWSSVRAGRGNSVENKPNGLPGNVLSLPDQGGLLATSLPDADVATSTDLLATPPSLAGNEQGSSGNGQAASDYDDEEPF